MIQFHFLNYLVFTNVQDEIWKPHPLVEETFLAVLASAIALEPRPRYYSIVNF